MSEFCRHDGEKCVAFREGVGSKMLVVDLVFNKDGVLVSCIGIHTPRHTSEIDWNQEQEKDKYDGPEYERVRATLSEGLASKLLENYDGDLTRSRYDIAWKLAEKYLVNYGCATTGKKSITIGGKVILETKCTESEEACPGVFECQFATNSSRALSCAILVGNRLNAQIYPHEREYSAS